jgi:hypothetical protein
MIDSISYSHHRSIKEDRRYAARFQKDTTMTTKDEEFAATCLALGKNDPCFTKLNLLEYGSLLDRINLPEQRASRVKWNAPASRKRKASDSPSLLVE